MNTKSLLTRIAVPVLGLGLLGGLGATLASSASAATVPAVSAYFWQPNGHALGGPQDMPGASVSFGSHYLAKITEPMHNADLTVGGGKTVTITGTISGTALDQYQGQVPGSGLWDANARIYFQGAGGTSAESPQGYEGQSWWADGSPGSPTVLDLNTQTGDFSLTMTVSPAGWSDWNGKPASENVALFNQAASHVRELGLSFGGGYFYENGVAGAGTLTNVNITVS